MFEGGKLSHLVIIVEYLEKKNYVIVGFNFLSILQFELFLQVLSTIDDNIFPLYMYPSIDSCFKVNVQQSLVITYIIQKYST